MSPPPGADADPALFLPPDVARELQVASLVLAGTTAVFIWDILDNLRDDYYLLFKRKIQIPTAMYFVSRIAAFVFVLGFTLVATYPLGDCATAVKVFDCFYPIVSGATSLLFIFRVRAIYGGQLLVTWIFGFLWICVVGSALIIPLSTRASAIGSLCVISGVPAVEGVPGTFMTVHDTGVFLAISYRLLSNSHTEHTHGGKVQMLFRSLFRGANLHAFSEALFREGQKYYMISLISNVLTVSMAYASDLNPIYRTMFAIPNIALTSIMACRVYRNAKLHYVKGPTLPLTDDSGIGRFAVPLSPDDSSYSMTTLRGSQKDLPQRPPPRTSNSIAGVPGPWEFAHVRGVKTSISHEADEVKRQVITT
ncbi:hypothetical protein B0H19DRAFT_1027132 [Mycena capillaripes]|nr:hypothetical protein B0H19DRAFT_1027132 [Mycena capillaripes]